MALIQTLAEGLLDIVGDVHGEFDALQALLGHLGYNPAGHHPDGRRPVFVGDLGDRGPDSPKVFGLVQEWVASGAAQCIAGNHELNLVNNDPKAGSGWFFPSRAAHPNERDYEPFARAGEAERSHIRAFIDRLPLILERADLRIVHAAWSAPDVAALRGVGTLSIHAAYQHFNDASRQADLDRKARDEAAAYDLEDRDHEPPMLHAVARRDVCAQMSHPVKVLTSGVEREAIEPFHASGKWRFTNRVAWWDDHDDRVPVAIGHYWRRVPAPATNDEGLFTGIPAFAWMGRHHNVFCVDYSVGARWEERRDGLAPGSRCKLAALRWPERTLMFADGTRQPTEGFRGAD